MDDGKTLRCPFDANHIIRSCNFEYHLIKCSSPNRINFTVCPFNARHYVKRSGFRTHLSSCEDRGRLVKEVHISEMKIEEVNDNASDNFGSLSSSNQIEWDNDEDWDEEIRNKKPLNTKLYQGNQSHYSHASKSERRDARNRFAEKHKMELNNIQQ